MLQAEFAPRGYYYHTFINGRLYDVSPDGVPMDITPRLAGGASLGSMAEQPQSDALFSWYGEHRYSYSYSTFDSFTYENGVYASGSWRATSVQIDQITSWNPWGSQSVFETRLGESWGSWATGADYSLAYVHSESTYMREAYGVSYFGDAMLISSDRWVESGSFDFFTFLSGDLSVESSRGQRDTALDSRQVVYSQDGHSQAVLYAEQHDVFDFTRVTSGQNSSVTQSSEHNGFAMMEWQDPYSSGSHMSQDYALHSLVETIGPGMATVHETSLVIASSQSVIQYDHVGLLG